MSEILTKGAKVHLPYYDVHNYVLVSGVGDKHFLGYLHCTSDPLDLDPVEEWFDSSLSWATYVAPPVYKDWTLRTVERVPEEGDRYVASDGRVLVWYVAGSNEPLDVIVDGKAFLL
jgi:hypothetical protein